MIYRLFTLYEIADAFGQKPFSFVTFLMAIALSAGWQITHPPYVADYSRYLPSKTSGYKIFWATFLGSVTGSQIAMTFGVLIAALDSSFLSNQVGFIGMLTGPAFVAFIAYAAIVIGKITVNSLNTYGGCMTLLTTFSSFRNCNRVSRLARICCIAGLLPYLSSLPYGAARILSANSKIS